MRHWSADSRTCTMEEGRDTACRCLHAARTAPRSTTTTPRSKVLEEGRERTSCETSLSLLHTLGRLRSLLLSTRRRLLSLSLALRLPSSLRPPPRPCVHTPQSPHGRPINLSLSSDRTKGKEGWEHEADRRRRADEDSEDELQAKVAAVSADWEREPQALAPSAAAALPLVETKEDSVGLDSGIERINAQRRAYAH